MATKQPPNYWKLGVIAAIMVALFLLGRSCGIRSVIKTTGSDTIVRHDTVVREYRVSADTIIYSTVYRPVIIRDTSFQYDVLIEPVDTAGILADYYAARFYSDTQALTRGVIVISDSVTQNRIIARRLTASGTDTTITRTITLTPPRRLVGYLDLTGMGGRHDFGAGIGFSLKLPSDRSYGVGVSYLWNGKMMYYGRASIPIRLK